MICVWWNVTKAWLIETFFNNITKKHDKHKRSASAGDFGILASFLGAPGQAAYAVTASGQPAEIPELSYGRLSNFSEETVVQGNGSENNHILSDLYVVNPAPSLERNSSRDDSLEVYNCLLNTSPSPRDS